MKAKKVSRRTKQTRPKKVPNLAETELEMFFNTALDLLCTMDFDGRFRKLSARWTQVLGWTEAELMVMDVTQRVHPDDLEATREELRSLIRGESVMGFINRYRTWDGNYRWLEWNSYGNAELGIIIAAARDITGRKLNEEALMEASRIIEQKNADLMEMMDKLRLSAITDALTGLYNRRYLTERIQEQTHRHHRSGAPFSFIIGDIDRFKQFNDLYGHAYGDFVLVRVAETLSACCRESDILSRWGGEEFLILLPDTEEDEACLIAGRMRSVLDAATFEHQGTPCHVTMTFGVSLYDPVIGADASVQRADRRLLKGKEGGRNRVECSD